jgi:hypothetical protein
MTEYTKSDPEVTCTSCGWRGNIEDLYIDTLHEPPGVCPACWEDAQDCIKERR